MHFKHHEYYFLFLTLFSILFLFLGLDASPLADWDENIYAEASRQMILRGDYLNIYINDFPFAEKPPFFLWEMSLSYHLFGINEFAARFPSAIAGLLSVWICFLFGKRIESNRFGFIWGIIYLTSFLPSIFARAAVIDHTFNFLIMLSAFSLYTFDIKYKKYCDENNKETTRDRIPHLALLTLASISMGLAVLTKGPLGGVIPLVGFVVYKWFYRAPKINLGHFLYCGFLSLTVASSWYLINYWIYGFRFVQEFIKFQLALFSKPLEGNQGPFYYHFLITIFGLFPWTPFLLLFKKKLLSGNNAHFKPLFIMGIAWVCFVLVLFSFISTKLPHYTASIYIPLSFMVAFCLEHYIKNKLPIPSWIVLVFVIVGILFTALISLIPFFIDNYLIEQQIQLQVDWPYEVFLTSFVLFLGIITSGLYFWNKKHQQAILIVSITMFIYSQGLWRYSMPTLLNLKDKPLLNLIDEAYQTDSKVVFHHLVSFAALFYGKKPIVMLHTYKFPGDHSILNQSNEKDTFIIINRVGKERFKKEHPLIEYVKDSGTYSMFLIPKQSLSSR